MDEQPEQIKTYLARDGLGRILPGQPSLNPLGRTKGTGRTFSKALDRALERLGEDGVDALMDRQLAVIALGDRGSEQMLKQLWDRHEGPVTQRIEATGDMRTLLVLEQSGQEEPAMPEGLFASEDVKQIGSGDDNGAAEEEGKQE